MAQCISSFGSCPQVWRKGNIWYFYLLILRTKACENLRLRFEFENLRANQIISHLVSLQDAAEHRVYRFCTCRSTSIHFLHKLITPVEVELITLQTSVQVHSHVNKITDRVRSPPAQCACAVDGSLTRTYSFTRRSYIGSTKYSSEVSLYLHHLQ